MIKLTKTWTEPEAEGKEKKNGALQQEIDRLIDR